MKIKIALIALILALAAPAAAQLPGMGDSSEMVEMFVGAVPPWVGMVDYEPQNPGPGDVVTVTASISPIVITEEKLSDVSEAILYYSTDGGETWEEESMDSDDSEELWTAEIPEQEDGTTVDFYVRAYTDVGDLDVEVQDNEIVLGIGLSQNTAIPDVLNMPGYDPDSDDSPFEHLTLIVEDTDTNTDMAPAANIQELRMGYDDDSIYIRLKMEDELDGGQAAPLNARAYMGLFINLPSELETWDARELSMKEYSEKIKSIIPFDDPSAMMDMADRLSAWFWAPLAKLVPIMTVPSEAIMKFDVSSKKPVFHTDGLESDVQEDGTVDLKISRELLGPDTDMFMLLFADVEIAGDLMSPKVTLPDMAFPTVVRMGGQQYEVAE